MAKRYIGDAVITIEYVGETPDGRGNYKGTVRAGKHTWRFDELHSGVGGGGDSPEAYDEMAQSAVSFASYYTTHNRGDDTPEWAPSPEVADAIDEAVGYAQRDNGEYEVRRSPGGKAHEEATMHEMREPTPNRDRVHWKGDFSNNPRSGTIEISGDDGYAIVRWDDGKTERVPTSLFSTPRWSVERRGGPRPPPAAGPQPIPAPAPAPTRSAHKPPERARPAPPTRRGRAR